MHPTASLAAIAASSIFAALSTASAATVTGINSYDNGTYSRTGVNGSHSEANPSIPVGQIRDTGGNLTTQALFTVFDLAPLVGQTVTAASLTFAADNGTYDSSDAEETLFFQDITSNLDDLTTTKQTINFGPFFSDLVSGVNFGSVTLAGTSGAAMPEVTATLNADAVAAINAVLGTTDQRFGIAGSLGTSAPGLGERERLFQGSSALPAARLDLTTAGSTTVIPLPAGLPLLMAAIGALGMVRRKRA